MSTNGKTKTKAATPFMETGGGTDCIAIKARVDSIDWTKIRTDLDTQGWAVVPKLLTYAEADFIAGLYPQEEGFRSHAQGSPHFWLRAKSNIANYAWQTRLRCLPL
jgi:hypothetical protein